MIKEWLEEYKPQNEDEIIFGAEDKFRYVRGGVTKDLSYLIISASKATSGNNLFIKDLRNKTSRKSNISICIW